MSGEGKIIIEATISSCWQSKCSCNPCSVSVVIGLIVIAVIIGVVACIFIWRFCNYLKAKEENHKEEIEHKAYQKYMLMLEENNLSSINIVTKKGNEETSNITIKKNK